MASQPSSFSLRSALLTALLALVFGFLGAAVWSLAGLADNRTRAYLIDNPDVLPIMAERLQEQQQSERLAEAGPELYRVFPGAVLGNPQGSKTLVEFTDYNCPYCEASLEDVEQLIAADPDLRVVVREWPIFEGSEIASRMALAAALQGKYAPFHKQLFELGPITAENLSAVEAAASAAGIDMDLARRDMASNAVSVELARNAALARTIGFSGTPAWVTGNRALGGAVGYEALSEAIATAGPRPDGDAEG
jgi:protein-disulfide isomerase